MGKRRGSASDDKIETLRTQWIKASDSEARQEIAMARQQRAYVPTGAWKTKTAYRNNLKDLVLGPAIFQWNVENV
jgi:hypothetical protein